ncbi:AAA family ATPase [Spiroplasma clarkii]|uniref:AAA family ATPase n=1 Tax=Spiroplasma clarkii TaxID=2139 RepID=UPI001649AF55|nr:AAA family ATPase [Spiroplasma clarkii]
MNKQLKLFVFDAGKKDNIKKIYTTESYQDEITIATQLKAIEDSPNKTIDTDFETLIQEVETEIGTALQIQDFKYNLEQLQAIRNFLTANVSIITGGPGTGKTTVIMGIVKLYQKIYHSKRYAILAPTGRAASRINDIEQENKAVTIHRFLKARGDGEFEYNLNNPTSKKC